MEKSLSRTTCKQFLQKGEIEYKLHTSVNNQCSDWQSVFIYEYYVYNTLYIIAIAFIIVSWFTVALRELTCSPEKRHMASNIMF